MADENGFKKSILIPLSRYQQLLQYQNKTKTASPLTLTRKDNQSDEGQHDEPSKSSNIKGDNLLLTDYKTDTSVKPLISTTEAASANADDTSESEIERKILHTIHCSFANPLREKIARLFLFIINFGAPLITFNKHGNVLLRNRVIGGASNILDLLHACVSETATKPAGYTIFKKALEQINVPRHFLQGHSINEQMPLQIAAQKTGKSNRKSKKKNWQTY